MSAVDIICMTCGDTGTVGRVTASLHCGCGSSDLDLYTGTRDQQRLALYAPHPAAPFVKVSADMFPATPTHQAPPTLPGWDEYAGPELGKNDMSNGVGTVTCPTCHGQKYDLQDGGPCRACHGTGVILPTTTPEPPAVARHGYPSTQTSVPFMGSPGETFTMPSYPDSAAADRAKHAKTTTENPNSVEYQLQHSTPEYSHYGPKGPKAPSLDYSDDNPKTHYPKADTRSPAVNYRKPRDYSEKPAGLFQMPGSSCPNCGHEPLHLQQDKNEDSWMGCKNCGPLANIDKHPNIDPYNLGTNFTPPNEKFRAGEAKTSAVRKTGLRSIISTVSQHNPGLSRREIVTLARQTVERY